MITRTCALQAAEIEITHASQWVAALLMFINYVAALEQFATEGLVGGAGGHGGGGHR
jgi:hypothetical protein